MLLSPKQFDELRQNSQLKISLIGMSNVGKTFWAKKLSGVGFRHFCCDDLIEAKLEPELKALGYQGIADVSKWLGQPYDQQFSANQDKYLQMEIETMREILDHLNNQTPGNDIIDPTGSVIHTSDEICSTLKQRTPVVYLQASEQMKQQMFLRYLERPKPVVWGDIFQIQDEESKESALKRCYSNLLDHRNQLYAKYADAVIPREQIYDIETENFLDLIREAL